MLWHATAVGFFYSTRVTWSVQCLRHKRRCNKCSLPGRGLQTLFTQTPTPAFEQPPTPLRPRPQGNKGCGWHLLRSEKRSERDADYSPSSSAEFTNKNSNHSPLCLHAVDREKMYLYAVLQTKLLAMQPTFINAAKCQKSKVSTRRARISAYFMSPENNVK